MFEIVKDLYFSRREIVSDEYDAALAYLCKKLPLKVHKIPTGTKCWTWIVPEKWSVGEAYIEADGKRLLDIKNHPLHVISYSLPIDKMVSKDELLKHLHSDQKRPATIPFQYKYYERDWGFCIEHNRLKDFTYDQYHVVIKSKFENDSLKVGELKIKGETNDTIVLVAHLDHPAMANDDLAGVAVLAGVSDYLLKKDKSRYSYRILILPETIGSIAFLSQNEKIIPDLKFGIFFEMLGNENDFSLQLSRQEDTLIDKAARNILKHNFKKFSEGPFREVIANDEMVFNGPGLNIPMISISRWPYPEYHSSDDNISIIKQEKLEEAKRTVIDILEIMEKNYYPIRKFRGPPFLSGYGLWVDWQKNLQLNLLLEKIFMEFEGKKSLIDIADQFDIKFELVYEYVNKFVEAGLVEKKFNPT